MADKLLAYYRLQEETGVVRDERGVITHSGTVVGTPLRSERGLISGDRSARSFKFSNGNYIDLGTPFAFAVSTWSIECVFFADANPQGSGLISRQYVSPGAPYVQWELGFDADGTGTNRQMMTGFYTGAAWAVARDPVDIEIGKLYHGVGSFDGSVLRVHKQGVEVAQNTPGLTPVLDGGIFMLGRRHDAGAGQYGFPGWASEFAIYSPPLTPAEIAANAETALGGYYATIPESTDPSRANIVARDLLIGA
jgi:hypothetical protein